MEDQTQSKKILTLKKQFYKEKNLRLALDMGTNSIGWAVYKLNEKKKPINILGTGVRIFSSGRNNKDYTTLNATRRQKRLQRRQRDRYLQRRTYLLCLLKKHGLFPKDPFSSKKLKSFNPYELRKKGLDEKLNIYHFGRTLFHINQKRGFKSNRKSGDPKETGLITKSIKASKELMEKYNSRTYGEFLWKRFQRMEKSRRKPGAQQEHWVLARRAVGTGTNDNYSVYSNRKMIEEEFNKLWDSQSRFYEKLKDKKLKEKFFKAIFFQRNLKKPIVGDCILTGEKRISKALPSFQQFRILKELNNLSYINTRGESYSIIELKKGLEFRDKIITDLFLKKPEVKFSHIKKAFKDFFPDRDDFSRFNLDSFNRDVLEGDKTACKLQKTLPNWDKWNFDIQNRFVELLEGEDQEGDFMKDDEKILKDLKDFSKTKHLNLSNEQLNDCLKIAIKLPSGHGRYSRKAIHKIIPFLTKGEQEFKAISLAGFSPCSKKMSLANKLPQYQEVLSDHCVEMSLKKPHSKDDKSQSRDKYKNFRIPNPTVHIAFNQLKLLVNDIIKVYGKPLQTVIETAKDLPLGAMTKKELERNYKTNKLKNDEASKAIEDFGQKNNRANRFRYRLWKEQKETCLYSGKIIPKSKLFTAELEVDHILPWSQTLDDGLSNKVLVYKPSNQNKSNKTPFEFFSSNEDNWMEILDRAKDLPNNKRWRFNKNAMEIFLKHEKNFLDRQLNDTRYISKYAKSYLERICSEVWTVRGQTTSILSHLLKNEKKNRDNHKHHAQDALVIGLIDRSFVQNISNVAKNIEGKNKERLENVGKAIKKDVLPWDSFKEDAKISIGQIIVSHRKRTKKEGELHNETAYGILSDIKDFSKPVYVKHYVDILSFEKKKIETIISDRIKTDFLQQKKQEGKLSKQFLEEYHKKTGIRRIRIREKKTVIPIKNKAGKTYKAFKGDGNYAMEFFEKPNGKWDGKMISRFEANQKSFTTVSEKRLIMRGNMLFFQNRFWRVVKLSGNQITFSEHFEANVDARNRDPQDPYKYTNKSPGGLQKLEAKKVDISPCGVVKITSFNLKPIRTVNKKIQVQ